MLLAAVLLGVACLTLFTVLGKETERTQLLLWVNRSSRMRRAHRAAFLEVKGAAGVVTAVSPGCGHS